MFTSKVRIALLMLFLGTSIHLRAQMGMSKIEDIEAVQARKLIVMIEEPREHMLKNVAQKPKRGSVEDYKADLKTYNENIMAVVEKFWPYNKEDIQYKTFDEIMALNETRTKDYVVIACLSTEARLASAGYKHAKGLYWVKDIKEDFEDRDDRMFSILMVNTIEDFKKYPVYHIPLFDVFPTKASIVYGIKGMENHFSDRIEAKKHGSKMRDEWQRAQEEISMRAPQLSEKILLIREEWLDKGLTKENLKDFYPYPYQICDRAFMDEIIMNQDRRFAYAVELPYVTSTSSGSPTSALPAHISVSYFQFVIDAADARPMTMIIDGRRNFTEKTIARIVEQIKGIKK